MQRYDYVLQHHQRRKKGEEGWSGAVGGGKGTRCSAVRESELPSMAPSMPYHATKVSRGSYWRPRTVQLSRITKTTASPGRQGNV
jgi:hypothetical protein